MLSTARHNTPISPGGRMPTRAERSPPITFWAMATTRRMGRSTNSVASTSSARLTRVAPITSVKTTPLITLHWCEKGACSRPTPSTPMIRPAGSLIGSLAVMYQSLTTNAGARPDAAAVQHFLAHRGAQLRPHRPRAVFRL